MSSETSKHFFPLPITAIIGGNEALPLDDFHQHFIHRQRTAEAQIDSKLPSLARCFRVNRVAFGLIAQPTTALHRTESRIKHFSHHTHHTLTQTTLYSRITHYTQETQTQREPRATTVQQRDSLDYPRQSHPEQRYGLRRIYVAAICQHERARSQSGRHFHYETTAHYSGQSDACCGRRPPCHRRTGRWPPGRL